MTADPGISRAGASPTWGAGAGCGAGHRSGIRRRDRGHGGGGAVSSCPGSACLGSSCPGSSRLGGRARSLGEWARSLDARMGLGDLVLRRCGRHGSGRDERDGLGLADGRRDVGARRSRARRSPLGAPGSRSRARRSRARRSRARAPGLGLWLGISGLGISGLGLRARHLWARRLRARNLWARHLRARTRFGVLCGCRGRPRLRDRRGRVLVLCGLSGLRDDRDGVGLGDRGRRGCGDLLGGAGSRDQRRWPGGAPVPGPLPGHAQNLDPYPVPAEVPPGAPRRTAVEKRGREGASLKAPSREGMHRTRRCTVRVPRFRNPQTRTPRILRISRSTRG